MAGIYIHIPFCRKACHYCNFHFSTQLQYKEKIVQAIAKELFLRKDELQNQTVETLYLGGGTPSLLSYSELELLLNTVHSNFKTALKEITLEANPDDIQTDSLQFWKQAGINRLSIGIQSFEESHLKLMNRTHTAAEALQCVDKAIQSGIEHVSTDLIYGIPGMDISIWKKNLDTMLSMDIEHLSAYCLTVEEKTVFGKWAAGNKFQAAADEDALAHFEMLQEYAALKGFEHYEISNFARGGAYSKHNTAYWFGSPYLGAGPGAHSFIPGKRMWNPGSNQLYLKNLNDNNLILETEILGKDEQYHEWIMTRLRTMWGADRYELSETFGAAYLHHFEDAMKPYEESGMIALQEGAWIIQNKGKFMADGIAAAAFRC